MNDRIEELEAQLAAATEPRERIDVLNALAYELSEFEPERLRTLAEEAHALATSGEFETRPYPKGLAESLLNFGWYHLRQSDHDVALSRFLESLSYFEELGQLEAQASALNGVGLTYLQLGDYANALEYLLEALNIYAEKGNRYSQAVMLNNLGILHLEVNDAPQALSYLTRCLQLARETGNESIQAAALDNTSNAYYQIGQYENALASAIESVRLCQELGSKSGEAEAGIRQRTAQLEALREVGLEITAQLGLDSLLRSIVAQASEMLGDVSGGLYLYQPERDVLEWAVSIGSHAAPAGIVLQRGEGLAGKVWETGKPLIVDDYQSWAGRAAAWEDYPVVAVMGVPVCWGQGFLGVLNVAADASRSFSQADAELLGLFATQAAIAIRYAWLYEEAQEEIAERKRAEEQREKLIAELREALARVKTLSGLLPICATCKKIRDDQGYWHQVEVYVRDHSEADFTHGICPDCWQRLYPELYPEKE